MFSCSECGRELPTGKLEGLCPRCLLESGLCILRDSSGGESGGNILEPVLRKFGDYDLLEEVARGGMGVVYRARQRSLDRIVAIKLLLRGPDAEPDFIRRLRAEAMTAAGLRHPNIVTIHEVGFEQDEAFLAMDFIAGPNLAQRIRSEPLPVRAAARYLAAIAEAIHYAHERGVLHRDLKPSNILIDADDQPQVTDFGLAKRLDGNMSLTRSGQVIGSPNYMPPEQASASRHHVGRGSDVYSLGAMLYHMVAGRPPIVGEELTQTLDRVLNHDPVAPSLLNPGVPRDLDTICLKCLEKEPSRRYGSARDLAEELRRFLGDTPIRARPIGLTGKVGRWCRRNPLLAFTLTTATLLVLFVAIASPIAAFRLQSASRKLEQIVYATRIHRANEALKADNVTVARAALNAISESPYQRELRGWEWRHLNERCRSDDMAVLRGHQAPLATVKFSPDDRWLASLGEDGVLKVWDAVETREIASWVAHSPTKNQDLHPWTPMHSLAFSPDGKRLATGGPDGWVRIWDFTSRRELLALESDPGAITALDFSPDGSLVATGSIGSKIRVWRISGHRPELLGNWLHLAPVQGLRFLADGKQLIAAGPRHLARWGIADLQRPQWLGPELGGAESLAISPDGKWMVSPANDSDRLKVWRLPEFEPAGELPAAAMAGSKLAFAADATLLAGSGSNGNITVFDLLSRRVITVLHGHEEGTTGLSFANQGRRLVTANIDGTVRLWSVDDPDPRDSKLRHGTKVQAIHFLSGSSRFITVGQDRIPDPVAKTARIQTLIKLWDTQTHAILAVATNAGAPVHNFGAVSPDDQFVAVNEQYSVEGASVDTVRFLALPSLDTLTPASIPGTTPAFVSISGDLVYAEGRQLLRRTSLGSAPDRLGVSESAIAKIAVSPDGLTAVTRDESRPTRLSFWDLQGLSGPIQVEEHTGAVESLAISRDGRFLASAGWDRTVGVWDLRSRRLLGRLRGHRGDVNCVAISPDVGTLASGSEDGTVRLWDLRTLAEMAVLPAHSAGVMALAFSPDGEWMACGSWDGSVLLWHAPSL
ncbi:MAG: serine/threonine protein kinase [Verrucomicrobiales bacterium]|nr:serine/threonine protein kinase [Verrucomicrobiales bacterium]